MLWRLRLAKTLRKTLCELDSTTYPWELPLWRALEVIDGPWDEARGDVQAARICMVAELGPVEPGTTCSMAEHMPIPWEPPKSAAEIEAEEKAAEDENRAALRAAARSFARR